MVKVKLTGEFKDKLHKRVQEYEELWSNEIDVACSDTCDKILHDLAAMEKMNTSVLNRFLFGNNKKEIELIRSKCRELNWREVRSWVDSDRCPSSLRLTFVWPLIKRILKLKEQVLQDKNYLTAKYLIRYSLGYTFLELSTDFLRWLDED